MMTNKDELENEKHLCMTYVEFLEALARVSDYFNWDIGIETGKIEDHFKDFKSKHPKQLDKKLESTIIKLLEANLTPRQFKYAIDKYTAKVEEDLERESKGVQMLFTKE
jgi:hypothetical protein